MFVRRLLRSRPRTRMGVVAVGLLVLLGLLFTASLSVGAQPISLPAVWAAVTHPDGGRDAIIVWQLRMPRTMLAVGVGVLLAVAGVLMQAITRNPLAEPGLLGVNAGASLAVVVSVGIFGMGQRGAVMGAACVGAAGAAVVVMLVVVRSRQRAESTRLVLAGAALTASLSSVTGVITLADERTFGDYRSWVIGSVANRELADMGWLTPVAIIVVLGALLLARPVELLAMGDEAAVSLGVAVSPVRLLGFALIVVACGSATAVTGPISFVGLVVPHAVRLLLGHRMCAVLLGSLFTGPALLLSADIIGRIIAPPGEIEAGIVTAFIGAPVLIGLVQRRRRSGAPIQPVMS